MRATFGEFSIPIPDEEAVVADIVRRAKAGVDATSVVQLDHTAFGWEWTGVRRTSVDLRAGTVTSEEEWGGVLTARSVRRLGMGP